MIELRDNELVWRFPELHADAVCRIGFERTLRIPDDNRDYPLPPGLGRFPLRHVDDHLDSVPESWGRHGGVFLPMYQGEAMWLHFDTAYPMAVKVAAGKIDALTGEHWTNELSPLRQNYLVVPDQPWLDGFSVGKGLIRQFVAMPLGQGYTAEEQLAGEGQHGGLQLVVYPMQASRYEDWKREAQALSYGPVTDSAPQAPEMGLAPGGLMRQEVYSDDYGFDAWDRSVCSRCFVHVLNSVQFFQVSGVAPPAGPPHGQGVHRDRVAVVRVLRRRPGRTRRRDETGEPGQRGRDATEEGRWAPRGQRRRSTGRRHQGASRPGTRG